MRRKTWTPAIVTLLACSWLSPAAWSVDCTPDLITLSSQAEVNDFQLNHGPGCDTVVTGLTIEGASINDLTPLAGLTAISTVGPFSFDNKLQIDGTAVTSLAGLENLATVHWIELNDNTALTDLTALSGLVTVRGPLVIDGNSALTNVDGLENLTALAGGALFIENNIRLTDLSGLSNIDFINASLVVTNNDALTNLDAFSGLRQVSSNISITQNDNLTNLGGLGGLVGFDETLNVRFNNQLTSLGDLSNLSELGGLVVWSNPRLTSLDGLENLTRLGNNTALAVRFNDALTSIAALSNVVSAGFDVEFSDNPSLRDCSALVTLLDDVDDADPGPGPGGAGIPDVGGDVTIEDNDTGCNSLAEVLGPGGSGGADLSLEAEPALIDAPAGATQAIDLTVFNDGPDAATNVEVRGVFSGTVVAGLLPTECAFESSSATLLCLLPQVPASTGRTLSPEFAFPDSGAQTVSFSVVADQADPDLVDNDLSVPINIALAPLTVPQTFNPPVLDSSLALGEWASAASIELPNSRLSFLHDQVRLYVLINAFNDTRSDPFAEGGADQFWLLFDLDEDGAITPDVDRRYRLQSGTGNLRFETFADDSFLFNPLVDTTFSARAEGFGCFVADGSLALLPSLSCNQHRVWEVAIDLREIDAAADGTFAMGALVQSQTPAFVDTIPSDLASLAAYRAFQLQGDATISALADETPLAPNILDPIQAIHDPVSPLDLVAGKPAFARVVVGDGDDEGRAIVSLYGTRNGVELPGSPLTRLATRRPVLGDLRAAGSEISNFALPESWTRVGTLSLQLRTRQPWIASAGATTPIDVPFIETVVPTYWTVPYDTGTAESPVLIDDGALARDEDETVAALPVADIDFVRRPPVLDDPPDGDAFIDALNGYHQTAVLAWTFGLLLTGAPPFDLPDQVVGARRNGYPGSSPGTVNIGKSDPVWVSGSANVAWIADTRVDFNLAHEVNHNLDGKATATWGRHVSDACGTESDGDANWPYGNDDIQEVGLLTVDIGGNAVPRRIGDTTPDFMSYCTDSPQLDPNNWISPYRWRELLAQFDTASKAARRGRWIAKGGTLNAAFYVSGRIRDDGAGELDPVIAQPGPIETPVVAGDYAIDIKACEGSLLASHAFTASFVDVELEPRDTSPFAFVLPDPGGVCAIELRFNATLLDRREVSANAPSIQVTAPNGGEVWDGTQTISWVWSDGDGDELTAAIFHSADDGSTWIPVASGVAADSYQVDTTGLNGSGLARIRVLVSDGVNTRFDDSDEAFTIVTKPPRVFIRSPGPASPLTNGQPIRFRGLARDADGHRIGDDALRWFVDGQALGVGATVTAHLASGPHVVLLQATDGDQMGEARLEIEVSPFDRLFESSFEADE